MASRKYSVIFYFRVHVIPYAAKINNFYDALRIDLNKASTLFVSLKNLVLGVIFLLRKCFKITAFPPFIQKQGRYIRQYGGNSHP